MIRVLGEGDACGPGLNVSFNRYRRGAVISIRRVRFGFIGGRFVYWTRADELASERIQKGHRD